MDLLGHRRALKDKARQHRRGTVLLGSVNLPFRQTYILMQNQLGSESRGSWG